VPQKGMGVQVPPRTHRDHELTCGYAIGAALEAHSSRSFLQVRAMGVRAGFRSRNDNNTLRPRRMSKLRFNGRSPLTGHRKPAQAHKRCRVIAASAVTRLSGCLPPDLVRARVSSDRRCSAATPSSCRTAARRHPQPLSGLAVIPSGTLTTVEPGLIRIDPVSPAEAVWESSAVGTVGLPPASGARTRRVTRWPRDRHAAHCRRGNCGQSPRRSGWPACSSSRTI
jgi:hypothetical protein